MVMTSTSKRCDRMINDSFWQNVAKVAEETACPPDSFWWLSFCDPDLPEGTQFLGACMVQANSIPAAITTAHLLGINPGGEVAVAGPITPEQRPPGHPINRLMSREEIESFDYCEGTGTINYVAVRPENPSHPEAGWTVWTRGLETNYRMCWVGNLPDSERIASHIAVALTAMPLCLKDKR
jgi:hypothetical protein